MEESKQIICPHCTVKGKKGLVARIFGALSLLLVIAILLLLIMGRLQQSTSASSLSDKAADANMQSVAGFSAASSPPTANPANTAIAQQSILASAADVTVDFGNRQNATHPIPSTFLGVGGVGLKLILKNNANAVLRANFHLTKLGDYDFMGQIFPTAASVTNPSQQNWALFDE